MGRRLSERFNRTQELRKLLESPDRLNAAVDSIFAEKDINRDGQLDFTEFKVFVLSFCKKFGMEEDEVPDEDALVKSFSEYDKNGDGTIDKCEFVEVLSSVLSFFHDRAVAWEREIREVVYILKNVELQEQVLENVFQEFDASEDGKLGADEMYKFYVDCCSKLKIPPSEIPSMEEFVSGEFVKLDRDGDGSISREELLPFLKLFFRRSLKKLQEDYAMLEV